MTSQDALDRVLVIIPTFNEAQNIESITNRLRRAVPDAHILVADDNSPDGTGAIADRLAASDDHIHVMHRKGKEGLGAAYLAGLAMGIWKDIDELKSLWHEGVRYEPQMDEERRSALWRLFVAGFGMMQVMIDRKSVV